jgi:hypothetical protein
MESTGNFNKTQESKPPTFILAGGLLFMAGSGGRLICKVISSKVTG